MKSLHVFFLMLCLTMPAFAQQAATSSATPDWNALGNIAVMYEGRLKPLDTVARSNMLMICGKQTVKVEGRPMHALEWLMDVMCKPQRADLYRVFLIHDPDIQSLLKLGEEDKRWSFEELAPQLSLINEQARLAMDVQSYQRNRYQRAIIELYHHMSNYILLKNSIAPESSPDFGKDIVMIKTLTDWLVANPDKVDNTIMQDLGFLKQKYDMLSSRSSIHFVPPIGDLPWMRIPEHLRYVLAGVELDPSVKLFATIRQAYRDGDWATINQSVAEHLQTPAQQQTKVRSEATFNRISLLVNAMPVYVLALVITLLAMVFKQPKFLTAGVVVVLIAFAMHTIGLGWRMWIEGRPPVINLYGSAVFIGWGATVMALVLEKIFKNGLGTIAATLIGFATLIIAHHLSLSGDTIEPVRAVLDSNFWLSTHVLIVTLGYSAMFVAGAIGMIYVVADLVMRLQVSSDPTMQSTLNSFTTTMGRMVYGIICFAMLFSFVGTVLGGIWADQSWGRFWGWDPKENGALLIVLWNAATLHARWGGMIQVRGMMLMALLGNCITAFSWFGVNMMGVGLHSYGFMEGAFFWLIAFWFSQLLFIAIGLFPISETPMQLQADKGTTQTQG